MADERPAREPRDIFAEQRGLLRPFALAAVRMAFREGADLSDLAVVLETGRRVGIGSPELEAGLSDAAVKQALRDLNDEALAAGVFGVPSVLVGGELFWGDDRLVDAVEAHRAMPAG